MFVGGIVFVICSCNGLVYVRFLLQDKTKLFCTLVLNDKDFDWSKYMNYYEILEIQPSASEEVIRMAYKGLVKKYHPDTYDGDSDFANEMLVKINMAFETLSNKEKRAEYDQQLSFDKQKGVASDTANRNDASIQPYNRNSQSEKKRRKKRGGFFRRIIEAIGEFISSVIGIVILYVIIGLITGNLTKWNINLLYYAKTAIHFVQQFGPTEKYNTGSAEAALNEYIKAIVAGDEILAEEYIDTDNVYLVIYTETLAAMFKGMDAETDEMMKMVAEDMRRVKYEIIYDEPNCVASIKSGDYVALFREMLNTNFAKKYNDVYEALNDDKKFDKYLIYEMPHDNTYKTNIRMEKDDGKWVVADIENALYFGNAMTGNILQWVFEAEGVDFNALMSRSKFWTYSGIWVMESGNVYLSLSWDWNTVWDNGTASLTFYEEDGSFINIDFDLAYGDGRILGESMDYSLPGKLEILPGEDRDAVVVRFVPSISIDNASRTKYRIDKAVFFRENR